MAKAADVYFSVDPWKVTEEGFNPSYSRVSESVFSLANESMGVRGSFDEGGSVDSLRGTYVNGVYDEVPLAKSYKGIIDRTHFMVPAADWLQTEIVLEGEKLDLGKVSFWDFRRELDLRTGVLTRSFVWRTAAGKELKLCFRRFMDMVNRERAYQCISMEALNFSGSIRVSCGISFDTVHEGTQTCYWENVRGEADAQRLMLQGRTKASGQEVFAGARVQAPGKAAYEMQDRTAIIRMEIPVLQGEAISIEKRVVVLFDGKEGDALWQAGISALEETERVTAAKAAAAQTDYWDAWWRTSDIQIAAAEGVDAAAVAAEQQGIRFCSFQLAQTYNGGSMRHNIGAKGLTGEAYNGHAFWDTEACCLPFYLFTNPEAARDLLLFRYNTLERAKLRAGMLDCRGACYPIATLNGDEACSLWQHASLQLQPSTAVAYGIWHYVQVTGDEAFLEDYGAEVLLEIARFLASRAEKGQGTEKYGFFGVMGPDEFHMMVNNNAYTNYMGKRTLDYAAQVLGKLRQEKPGIYTKLAEKTGLKPEETADWERIAAEMAIPQTAEGLIEQHDGYFNLPHTDIHAIPISEFPLYDHWSYDRIYRSDMIKQPDVLMMMYLYNSSFTEEVKRLNYDFYEPRTIHESSLSPAIHSVLAAELGKMEQAVQFFGYATRLDLDNYNRNTREGLHITSIAMAWCNIVYGFAGLRSDGEGLRFAPRLPERWRELQFSVLYRGKVIRIRMEKDQTVFRLTDGEQLKVQIYGKDYQLSSRETTVERE